MAIIEVAVDRAIESLVDVVDKELGSRDKNGCYYPPSEYSRRKFWLHLRDQIIKRCETKYLEFL